MKRVSSLSLLWAFVACALVGMSGCAAAQRGRSTIARITATNPPSVTEHSSSRVRRSGSAAISSNSTTASPDTETAVRQTNSTAPNADTSSVVQTVGADTVESDLTVATAQTDSGIDRDHENPAYSLDLGSILHLADAQNPNVALARERINESYARVQRAEALWLPSLRSGLNYNHHEGAIQSVAGDVFNTNRSAFGGGLGAGMYGAASPNVPGLLAQFHLSDAIFQPKIASHQAASRQFGAIAARNDVLRDAAVAYLELIRAEHNVAIAQSALRNTEKLAQLTRQYAETGEGLQSDFRRLQTELAIRNEQLFVQKEGLQVASARLAQVLHADPGVRITSGEPVVTSLELLTAEDSAAAHVALGLSRRPELSEQKHLVCEAVERLNREKYAPLIPSVLLGFSYGGMGGGLGNSITNSSQRWDADAIAYWELRNLGFGDRAAQGETASAARQAQMREVAILDRVAREVVEAHTQVNQRKQRVVLSRQGIAAAEQSYELNSQRIENAQGLPIEVLQSIQALTIAQQAYLNAVIDYNIAQFELCRATGWFVEP